MGSRPLAQYSTARRSGWVVSRSVVIWCPSSATKTSQPIQSWPRGRAYALVRYTRPSSVMTRVVNSWMKIASRFPMRDPPASRVPVTPPLLLEGEKQRAESLLATHPSTLEDEPAIRALHRAAGLLVRREVAALLERDERRVVVVARRIREVAHVGAGPGAEEVAGATHLVVLAGEGAEHRDVIHRVRLDVHPRVRERAHLRTADVPGPVDQVHGHEERPGHPVGLQQREYDAVRVRVAVVEREHHPLRGQRRALIERPPE